MNVTMTVPARRLGLPAPVGLALAAVAGCLPAPEAPTLAPPVRLVVTERWAGGGRLVVVDDAGDRQAVLVPPPAGPPTVVRDDQAAFSPDGRWIAFVSTRGGDLATSALWLIEARVGARPVRLTRGPGAALSPAWTADSAAVVYASDRAGSYDLYRVAIPMRDPQGRPIPASPPRRLTDAPSHEIAPTVAADGRLVAQVVEPGLAPRSYLALVGADGRLEPLTDGPLDATPAWAPDGRRLAYTTGRLRADGGDDTELMVLDTERDRPPTAVTDLPTTAESGPVWSRDGRWLFATSVLIAADGAPRWSSVIAIDLRAARPTPRMIRDRVGAIVRAGPALAPVALDAQALARAPRYLPALDQALRDQAAGDQAAPTDEPGGGAGGRNDDEPVPRGDELVAP